MRLEHKASAFITWSSGTQTGATWLTKGRIFNSWEESCFTEKFGRNSCGWRNLRFLLKLARISSCTRQEVRLPHINVCCLVVVVKYCIMASPGRVFLFCTA